jgi:hypothetical protein
MRPQYLRWEAWLYAGTRLAGRWSQQVHVAHTHVLWLWTYMSVTGKYDIYIYIGKVDDVWLWTYMSVTGKYDIYIGKVDDLSYT